MNEEKEWDHNYDLRLRKEQQIASGFLK